MSRVFISHSSRDKKTVVSKLARSLMTAGLEVWLDEWCIKPGERLREKINSAILNCECFIIVLTKNSINSEWVKLEIDTAMIREIETGTALVVPVLAGTVNHTDIPADLRGKLYLDLRPKSKNDYSREIDRLIRAILGENSYSLTSAHSLDAEPYSESIHGISPDGWHPPHPLDSALDAFNIRKRWYVDKHSRRAGIYLENGMYPSAQMSIMLYQERIQRMHVPIHCDGSDWELGVLNDRWSILRLKYIGVGAAGHFFYVIKESGVSHIKRLALSVLEKDLLSNFTSRLNYFYKVASEREVL